MLHMVHQWHQEIEVVCSQQLACCCFQKEAHGVHDRLQIESRVWGIIELSPDIARTGPYWSSYCWLQLQFTVSHLYVGANMQLRPETQ